MEGRRMVVDAEKIRSPPDAFRADDDDDDGQADSSPHRGDEPNKHVIRVQTRLLQHHPYIPRLVFISPWAEYFHPRNSSRTNDPLKTYDCDLCDWF